MEVFYNIFKTLPVSTICACSFIIKIIEKKIIVIKYTKLYEYKNVLL